MQVEILHLNPETLSRRRVAVVVEPTVIVVVINLNNPNDSHRMIDIYYEFPNPNLTFCPTSRISPDNTTRILCIQNDLSIITDDEDRPPRTSSRHIPFYARTFSSHDPEFEMR